MKQSDKSKNVNFQNHSELYREKIYVLFYAENVLLVRITIQIKFSINVLTNAQLTLKVYLLKANK